MVPKLAPMNPPLGPQPDYRPGIYSAEQVTLAMKEKVFSLSGDDFTVKKADGTPVCKCKAKLVSVRDKKKFLDREDNEIFHLTNKLLSIHKSFHGESPDGKADFEIGGKFAMLGSKSEVTFKNASNGHKIELEVKGNWIDRSAEITWGGTPVAQISRSWFSAREWFGDKQTYFVTVAGNVDLSLIAAICVALDEREIEDKK